MGWNGFAAANGLEVSSKSPPVGGSAAGLGLPSFLPLLLLGVVKWSQFKMGLSPNRLPSFLLLFSAHPSVRRRSASSSAALSVLPLPFIPSLLEAECPSVQATTLFFARLTGD